MIDWTKPVQTRDGRKVRVLCIDMKSSHDTVVGLVETGSIESAITWQSDGRFGNNLGGDRLDLINVPETRVVWVNIYPKDSPNYSRPLESKSKADHCAEGASDREACIRVEYEVGQFDGERNDG